LDKRVVTRELGRQENLCDIEGTVYEDWLVDVRHDAERHQIFTAAEQWWESIQDYLARRDHEQQEAALQLGRAEDDEGYGSGEDTSRAIAESSSGVYPDTKVEAESVETDGSVVESAQALGNMEFDMLFATSEDWTDVGE
jgi:hypothetical protein